MPLSTRDEILIKYAELMQPELIKESNAFWSELLGRLGIDIGTGIVGGVSLVGALLLVPVVLEDINTAIKLSKNNVESLLVRLKHLQGSIFGWLAAARGQAGEVVNGWIKKLTEYQELPGTLEVGSQEQRVAIVAQKLASLLDIIEYIKTIERDWPQVKNAMLEDRTWAAGLITHSLAAQWVSAVDETLPKVVSSLESESQKMKDTIKGFVSQQIQEAGKKTGQNYKQLSKDINDLYAALVKLNDDVEPRLDERESATLGFARSVLKEEQALTEKEMLEWDPALQSFKNTLTEAINYLSKENKKSSIKYPISKRALQLSDGTNVGPQGILREEDMPNATMAQIQKLVKAFKNYIPGVTVPEINGIFDMDTKKSLVALLNKIPELKQNMEQDRKEGMTYQQKLEVILSHLDTFYKQKTESIKSKQQAAKPVGQCPWGKPGMNDNEIESCLNALTTTDETSNRQMTVKEFLQVYNYLTPEDRARVVKEQLGFGEETLPGDWTDRIRQLIYDVKKTHTEQPGESQIDFEKI